MGSKSNTNSCLPPTLLVISASPQHSASHPLLSACGAICALQEIDLRGIMGSLSMIYVQGGGMMLSMHPVPRPRGEIKERRC